MTYKIRLLPDSEVHTIEADRIDSETDPSSLFFMRDGNIVFAVQKNLLLYAALLTD